MQNVHVLDKALSRAAHVLPLPTPHGTFRKMSVIPSLSRDLLACSFSSPNSINIYALQQNAVEQLQSITVDFEPYSSIWLSTLKTLLVFDCKKSNQVASVFIDRSRERIRTLEMEGAMDVYCCCILKGTEKVRIESLILFDFETKSLLTFDVT